MTRPGRAVALAVVLVVAGCGLPADDATSSPRPTTPTATPTPTETTPATPAGTPTATPTGTQTGALPPGVNESGIENVSALLAAHTAALDGSGYVAVGTGNTSVLRQGFLVEVDRRGRTVVAAGSDRYYEARRTDAGPLRRRAQRYGNGSVELERRVENGKVSYGRREARSAAVLAGAKLLSSLLRAGAFRTVAVRRNASPAHVVLRANRTANRTAALASLPPEADRVLGMEASVTVDLTGRVRALNATVEFVVAGRNRTHRVGYDVVRLGVTGVERPDWVDEAAASTAPSPNGTATPGPTPTPSPTPQGRNESAGDGP